MPRARSVDSGDLGAAGRSPHRGPGAEPRWGAREAKNKGVLEVLRAILSIETSTKLMLN